MSIDKISEISLDGKGSAAIGSVPTDALKAMEAYIDEGGGAYKEPPEYEGSVGRTMFDTASSEDGTITVISPAANIAVLPSQALVRVKSLQDKRTYIGAVVKGPFAEPDGLRGDAPVLITATAHGTVLLPKYHGRLQVAIFSEELADGRTKAPKWRPRPNSPVFALSDEETEAALGSTGDISLGMAEGHENVEIRVPSSDKRVFPRHLGVLGTTGGGKSTTVSGLVAQAQASECAVIILDTEGEYCAINEATKDESMKAAFEGMKRVPSGIPNTRVFHLAGRVPKNPAHPNIKPFTVRFSSLSPYAVAEIIQLNEAQETRFFEAYDVCRKILDEFAIFPRKDKEVRDADEKALLEWDDMEEGFPQLTLSLLLDVVSSRIHVLKKEEGEPRLISNICKGQWNRIQRLIEAIPSTSPTSWLALASKLWRLYRYKVFEQAGFDELPVADMVKPGAVTMIDLSDMDSPAVRNLVIAQALRRVQIAQEEQYDAVVARGQTPKPTFVMIEEAHEFLSAERIKQMPVLFQQVARIARRGRKRWLGLGFISQLPQHLPDEVLALINNWVLHKISDGSVVSRLRRSIGGIDDGVWSRLPNLAPGQAVVSFTTLTRPVIVAMNPTPCRLLMVD